MILKSKPYNVRVIRDFAVDTIEEFTTLEAAQKYAKRESKRHFCIISKVVEEMDNR